MTKDLPTIPEHKTTSMKTTTDYASGSYFTSTSPLTPSTTPTSRNRLGHHAVSLIRPDSLNVLSVDDLHYHRAATLKHVQEEGTKSDYDYRARISLHNGMNERKQANQYPDIVRKSPEATIRKGPQHLSSVESSTMRNPSIVPPTKEVPDSQLKALFIASPAERSGSHVRLHEAPKPAFAMVQSQPAAVGSSASFIDRTSSAHVRSASQESKIVSDGIPSPDTFKDQEILRCLSKTFQTLLFENLRKCLLSGKLTFTVELAKHNFMIRDASKERPLFHYLGSHTAKGDIDRAISWYISKFGWSALVLMRWKDTNHLQSVTIKLSIPLT